ncbi:MAG TPA: M20/M25/M40 family metallo-hydrolase [Tepidisphaeraceae bacterium]|nr:M20/M25/M40 family metallo-hydrolase [Tepidisphaeraceae bacterium]
MRLYTLAAALALSLAFILSTGCSNHSNGNSSENPELQFKLEALEREVQELRAAQNDPPYPPSTNSAPTTAPASAQVIAKIRDEGFNRSQVMATLSYLTDVIGPRLTGSPQLQRANEWTRDKLTSWGLVNAHVEPWGFFGRGWSLKRFSAQIIEPQAIPLIGYPKAYSPSLKSPLVAEVIHVEAKTEADLEKFKGKLKGAIILQGSVREVQPRFDPLALRNDDSTLLKMANSDIATVGPSGQARANTAAERRAQFAETPVGRAIAGRNRPTTNPSTTTTSAPTTQATISSAKVLSFLAKEGAAVVVTSSNQGDGGTFFVANASIPGVERQPFSATQPGPKIWAMDAPLVPPQITLAAEHYNRLVRMLQAGEKLKMAVELEVEFHDNMMGYNTIAEIPGTDLKDQIVMLGAHMDSWHSGTGATDNAAGCAAVMEAVRIIKALDLHPRRTIRIALWTGEEQGLFGSKGYVAEHFGSYPESTTRPSGSSGRTRNRPTTRPSTPQPAPNLIKRAEYEKLSVYFNLDNGTGKIRGVHLQGNEAARPLFRQWLAPFADLDALTLTISNTGGTDHISFDAIGLPGFQFIQDPIEYWSRTHHSNMDLYDHASADDLKQCSVIIASFGYNATMMDERFPRKLRLNEREVEAKIQAQTQPVR